MERDKTFFQKPFVDTELPQVDWVDQSVRWG